MNLSPYLGIPYVERGRDRDGVDCYGLVFLIYREVLGIELPRYEGAPDWRELEAVEAMLDDRLTEWIEVPKRDVRFGDVIVTRYQGRRHIGISLGGSSYFHAGGCGTTNEDLGRAFWNRRVEGCYRHAALAT